MSASAQTILFSKTDALGDQLLATGLVASLLEANPEARVIWCVRVGMETIHTVLSGSTVFMADPRRPAKTEAGRLKKIRMPRKGRHLWSRVTFVPIPLNAYIFSPEAPGTKSPAIWWINFARALEPTDAVAGSVTLNWLDHALVAASGAKRRIGYAESPHNPPTPKNLSSWLLTQQPAPGFTKSLRLFDDHSEQENLSWLAEGLIGRPGHVEIRVDPELPARPPQGGKPLVLLAPGSGDPGKNYPPTALADALARVRASWADCEIGVLEGPADAEACKLLRQALTKQGIASQPIRTEPDLTILWQQLGAARLLICNDSFWMHFASVIGTPAVAIFGLGQWPRFLPRQGHVTVVHTDMLCAGCNWQCCFPQRKCITEISSQVLGDAIRHRLEETAENRSAVRLVTADSPTDPRVIRRALQAQLQKNLRSSMEQQPYIKSLEQDRDRHAAEMKAARHDFKAQEAHQLKVINEQTAYIALLEKQQKESQPRLKHYVKVIEEQAAYIAELKKQCEDAEPKQAHYLKVMKEQAAYIAELEKQQKESRPKLKHYVKVIEEQGAYIAELKKQCQVAEPKQAHYLKVMAEQAAYIAVLKKQLNEAEPQQVHARKVIEEQTAYIATLKKQLDAAEPELLHAREVIAEQTAYIALLEKQQKESRPQLEHCARVIEEQTAYIATLRKQLDAAEPEQLHAREVMAEQTAYIALLEKQQKESRPQLEHCAKVIEEQSAYIAALEEQQRKAGPQNEQQQKKPDVPAAGIAARKAPAS